MGLGYKGSSPLFLNSNLKLLNFIKIAYQHSNLFFSLSKCFINKQTLIFTNQSLFISYFYLNQFKYVFYLLYFYGKKLLFKIKFFTKQTYKFYLSVKSIRRLVYFSPTATFFIQNNSLLLDSKKIFSFKNGGWLLAITV